MYTQTDKGGLSVYYFYPHEPFSPTDLGCRWPAIRLSEVEVFALYPYIFPPNSHLRSTAKWQNPSCPSNSPGEAADPLTRPTNPTS